MVYKGSESAWDNFGKFIYQLLSKRPKHESENMRGYK